MAKKKTGFLPLIIIAVVLACFGVGSCLASPGAEPRKAPPVVVVTDEPTSDIDMPDTDVKKHDPRPKKCSHKWYC